MMTLDDVRRAAAEHEIGCHSFAHESMGVESDEFFAEDLARCEALFREQLRQPLTIYAFLNGSYRPAQAELLAARGVRHVLLTGDRFAAAGRRVYPRLAVTAQTGMEARFQALGYRARPA
jgi:peptidoglycan/xylan/chitin deacetylase (PgdA/CDA1 family)